MPPRATKSKARPDGAQLEAASDAGAIPVKVVLVPFRPASQACAVVAVPLRVNPWVLRALQTPGSPPPRDAEHFDLTVLVFAAYEAAVAKLLGSTADAIKYRAMGADCGAPADGQFLISVTCAPTLAAARKCATVVLQQLRWGMLFLRYSQLCRELGARPDKAAYVHAAEHANKITEKGVTVMFAGRVSADAAGAERTAEMLSRRSKLSPPREAGSGRARAVRAADLGEQPASSDRFVPIRAPGLPGVVALDMITAATPGTTTHLVSETLFVPSSVLASARRLVASDRGHKFVNTIFRLGQGAVPAIIFAAAKKCLLPVGAVATNVTEDYVLATIRAMFAD